MHVLLPQRKARQSRKLKHLPRHQPLAVRLGRDALWRCGCRREPLRGDVRGLGDDLLLVEIAEDVGNHRSHLLAHLDLLDGAVLVDAAARDALEQLVEVERDVLDRVTALLLRIDKGSLALRHREPALELGAHAVVADDIRALHACERAEDVERLQRRHPLRDADLLVVVERDGGIPCLQPRPALGQRRLHLGLLHRLGTELGGVVPVRLWQDVVLECLLEAPRDRVDRLLVLHGELAILGVQAIE
mmetsp:Transcript_76869/g.152453  ORF Transcript_76869/g.152453 Transcript_76869/m.152453 type:complete len:246 (+) Transcript_76869:462-1199(+)